MLKKNIQSKQQQKKVNKYSFKLVYYTWYFSLLFYSRNSKNGINVAAQK